MNERIKANADIRAAAQKSGVYLWELADRYGKSDTAFTRLLRKELDGETKTRLMAIIMEIAAEKA